MSRQLGVQTRRSRPSFLWQVWIPPELLSKVFDYLTEKDRLKARLTCQRWNNLCLQPRFWDSREFSIKGKDDQEVNQISGYLTAFGSKLKNMSIEVNLRVMNRSGRRKTTKAKSRRVFAELKNLLNANQRLESFRCRGWYELEDFNADRIPFDKKELHRAMCRMLEGQDHLSDVTFMDTYLSEEEGCQVLEALTAPNTASKLTKLSLTKFFNCAAVYSMPRFLEMIGRFKKLKMIDLEYDMLNDSVLGILTRENHSLKRVYLGMEWFGGPMGIPFPPPDWRKAVEKSPDLEVHVVSFVGAEQCPYHIVLPDLPLFSLTLYTYINCNKSDEVVEREIAHAASCINHTRLKLFMLGWARSDKLEPEKSPWNRAEAFVALVQACPSLRHLCLDRTVTLDTLEQLAAAAQLRESKERGEGLLGHSARFPLQIHVRGFELDTSLERVMERVSAVNPFCKVHVCHDFYSLWEKLIVDGARLP